MKSTATRKMYLPFAVVAIVVLFAASVEADWPTAGHDAQRTSYAAEDEIAGPLTRQWTRKIVPYISTKSQIITVEGAGSRPDLVFVSTAAGVYALDTTDGSDYWVYPTDMPVTHSVTVVNGVVYVPCHDNKIHAVNAETGAALWQTGDCGGGFDVCPLVVNGKIYAGSRNGYFYCFDATDGDYLWRYKVVAGPISYSAAYANSKVFFAGMDCRAYALNADTGAEVWKTDVLPGEGFYSFWPVIAQDKVLFSGSNNYRVEGVHKLVNHIIRDNAWGSNPTVGQLPGPVDGEGFVDGQSFVDWQNSKPEVKTFFVLNQSNGGENVVAPILYTGNPGGNRYPPAIGPNGLVWIQAPHAYDTDFPRQAFLGWDMSGAKFRCLPDTSHAESADENRAQSLIGSNRFYWLHKNDQQGGILNLTTGATVGDLTDYGTGYATGTDYFNYGDHPSVSPVNNYGNHGNQNPPTPLSGCAYMHRSNAVICFGT